MRIPQSVYILHSAGGICSTTKREYCTQCICELMKWWSQVYWWHVDIKMHHLLACTPVTCTEFESVFGCDCKGGLLGQTCSLFRALTGL